MPGRLRKGCGLIPSSCRRGRIGDLNEVLSCSKTRLFWQRSLTGAQPRHRLQFTFCLALHPMALPSRGEQYARAPFHRTGPRRLCEWTLTHLIPLIFLSKRELPAWIMSMNPHHIYTGRYHREHSREKLSVTGSQTRTKCPVFPSKGIYDVQTCWDDRRHSTPEFHTGSTDILS